MHDWVKYRLEAINKLYPDERINKSKDRLTRLWKGDKQLDRYPFTYTNFLFNCYDDKHTPEERLRITLDEMVMRGHLNDDFIPSVFPGCRTSTMPSMFGAKEIQAGNDVSCERIIKSYDDIKKLPEPSLAEGTIAHQWLMMQEYMLQATGGTLPIHVTDMQGPVDIAAALWGYDNLFLAAYESPEHYHEIMSKATKAFIMFWQAQERLLGDMFVPTHLFGWNWVPKSVGASLSADSIVMVSGDFFDEHYMPYIAEIERAFGGVCVHSCGDFKHMFANLLSVPGLKGINASQMSVERLIESGLDGRCVAIVYRDATEALPTFDIARAHSLRVDLTVASIWPHKNGVHVPLTEMTTQLWDELKREDDKIVQGAYV